MRISISLVPRPTYRIARRSALAAPVLFASVLLMAPAAHAFDCACHGVKTMVITCVQVVTSPKYVKTGPYPGIEITLSKKKVQTVYRARNGQIVNPNAHHFPKEKLPLASLEKIDLYRYHLFCGANQAKQRSDGGAYSVQYYYDPPKYIFAVGGGVHKRHRSTCGVRTPGFKTRNSGVTANGAGNTNLGCPRYYKQVLDALKAKGYPTREYEEKP